MSEPNFRYLAAELFDKLKYNIENPEKGMSKVGNKMFNIDMINGLLIRAYDMGKKDK